VPIRQKLKQKIAAEAAELEAKKSLNDFINKENITSRTSVRMISSNLEQANDNKKNNFTTNVVKSTDGRTLIALPGLVTIISSISPTRFVGLESKTISGYFDSKSNS
jgi:hypothetical protein